MLLQEVNNAHQEFANNPDGYKAWFQTVRGDLKNDTSNGNKLLQTLELYDSTSGPTDQRLVQALDRNGQELENALDTYATNKEQATKVAMVNLRISGHSSILR